jgi:DNA replication protein DnaC
MRRLTANQRRDLMEIVEDRYGRSSTLITSQMPTDTWHEVIGDAILDRIVHNAYRLALDGPSMRKIQAAELEVAVPAVDTTSSTNETTEKLAKGAKK